MGVGMFFLIVFGSVILIFGVAAIVAHFGGQKQALNSSQKAELASLRRLVKEINADAHRYQELEPNFTSTVIDKVSNHYQKELES